jgi:heptosyltransferase I
MPAQQILFVKLSSLGDVIHHLPAVTDLARHRPGARISWAVEEAYADLVRLHPAVVESIPVGLRALRRHPLQVERWRHATTARRVLASRRWDFVVDTQGLLKSALVSRAAPGTRYGFDAGSARESAASWFYDERIAVPRALHAVERNRRLVAGVFGYAVEDPADYGLEAPPYPPLWAPRKRYVVMLHAASRAEKQWPDDKWVELARRLSLLGYATVFPGGTEAERIAAARLALLVPGALAAPPIDLWVAATLLAHAALVVGVDTGLTHLAVALEKTTVGIYRATEPALTGLHGASGVSLGGPGREPTVEQVMAALAP